MLLIMTATKTTIITANCNFFQFGIDSINAAKDLLPQPATTIFYLPLTRMTLMTFLLQPSDILLNLPLTVTMLRTLDLLLQPATTLLFANDRNDAKDFLSQLATRFFLFVSNSDNAKDSGPSTTASNNAFSICHQHG